MEMRRLLCMVLALVMTLSSFCGILPTRAFAAEESGDTQAEADGEVVASYEIPVDQVEFSEDGGIILNLTDEYESTDSGETEPAEGTEASEPAQETAPAQTEQTVPEETEETEPEETEPEETEVLPWHSFLAQESAAGMQKADYAALRSRYAAYLEELDVPAAGVQVSGQNLTACVSGSGQFSVSPLLYGGAEPWSSEALVTVDGGYAIFFDAQTVTASGSSIRACMRIEEYGLEVCQEISLTAEDTAKIRYTVSNTDSQTHSVEIRVLVDVCPDGADGALFAVDGETVASAVTYENGDVPEEIAIVNEDGGTVAALYTGDAGAVILCGWEDLFASFSTPQTSGALTDSAAGVVLRNLEAAPGGSAEACFSLGLKQTETEAAEETEDAAEVAEPLTYFQWVEENGIETADLSKEESSAVFEQYGAYRINFLAEQGELPDGGGLSGSVSNSYIEAAVSGNGRFTIGNRIGNPSYETDNNQILLFGHPNPSTSETLITIDGKYSNFFSADSTSYSSTTATATMNIPSYGIKVVQTLKLVESGNADFADLVQIQYKVYNNDSKSHNVGIRIMMDTMLANNDGAPFRVSSVGSITSAKVFTGSSIPSMYQVYDNLDNPTTLATGYLYRGSDTKPSKVQFCNWGAIHGSDWNHQVNDGDSLGDSAVGIYFNPTTIKAGKSTTVRTYYGVSVGTSSGGTSTVQGNMISVSVKDSSTGAMLEGVTVSYTIGSETKTAVTNASGAALLECDATAGQTLTVGLSLSKTGYRSTGFSAILRTNSCYVYSLSPASNKKPVIDSIMLDTGNACADLLGGSVTYDEDSKGQIAKEGATGTVKIRVTSNMSGCTYMLVQDETVLQKNTTGVFELNIRKDGSKKLIEAFKPQGNRYIKCVSADGVSSKNMKFNLNVRAAANSVEFQTLSLGDIWPQGGSRLAEGTLAALFLGDSVKFGPKNSKLSFQVEVTDDGAVRVGLNVDIKKWSTLDKDGKKLVEQLQDEMMDYIRGKNKKFADSAGTLTQFSVGKAEAEFVFCGYGEGKLENGKVRIDLTVLLALKGSASYTNQFLIGVVPAYIQVGAKAGAELKASANLYNGDNLNFAFYDGKFTPSVGVWLEGGAGVKGCVSIGAKGEGTVSMTFDLDSGSQLAKLTAQASLVAQVFLFEKELPLAKKTITLYDSNDKEGAVYGGDENIFEMLDEQPYKLSTRESASENADGGTSGSVTDTRILTVNGVQYKFCVTDRGGNLSNRNMLTYARMENGAWTEDAAVMDDGTSDLYYDVATDGSRIYVVWSNSSKLFDDETVTVDEMAAAQEIYYAVIDGDGTVGEPVRLTDDSAMDVMPAVTVADGTVYAAWYHTANGIENDTDVGDHYLYYTSITDGAAGSVQRVSCGSSSINSVSADMIGGVPVASYVTNASDEYSFTENVNHEINMTSGQVSTVDTADKTVGKAVTGSIGGETKVFWLEDGNIAYADSMTAESPAYVFAEEDIPGTIPTNGYTVISVSGNTYFIWVENPAEEGENAVAMTAVYADGQWSAAHKLTELQAGNITSLDGYLNGEGKLVLVYTVKNYANNDEGGVDTTTATLEKTVDAEKTVRIADIGYENADAVPGQVLPMTISVVNTGNTAIDSLNVQISGQDDDSYATQITGLNIGPGASAEFDISDFALSSGLTTRTTAEGQYVYTVTVRAEGSEIAAEDTFEIGYDDLHVYMRDTALVDNREHAIIVVENRSGFAAANVHLRVLADAMDGVLIYDDVFTQIPGNSQMAVYLDVEDMSSTSLFVSVSSDCTAGEETTYSELILSNPTTVSTLTVEAYGGGTVTPAEPAAVSIGETVAISAAAQPGYVFDRWESYKDITFVAGGENTPDAQIVMPSGDTTITARFVSETVYDFTLSTESAALCAGDKLQLEAVFASALETGKVTWTSSDEAVAAVSDRGVVTGIAAGEANITAACGEYVHTCTVTVDYADITSIQMIYPEWNLAPGATANAEVLTDPANGEASLLWSSSDETVAAVDGNGVITAVGYGTAVITASSRKDETITAQCTVSVIQAVTDIIMDQMIMELQLSGEGSELHVVYDPVDADYGKEIAWSVDADGVVEITASGDYRETLTVKPVSCGDVTITARTEDGLEANCSVTVRDTVYASTVEQMQSDHPYEGGLDRVWVYTDETKDFLVLTFDEETQVGDEDHLYVMDGDGNVITESYGNYFSGEKCIVEGSTVQIRLISAEESEGNYGFRVTEIKGSVSEDDIAVYVSPAEYTGKAVSPYVSIRLGDTYLERGVHYTLTYSNNKNVGIGKVRVKGLGYLDGIVMDLEFNISPSNTEINANVASNGIKLTWAASKGAGGYELYRSVDGGEYELYKKLSASARSFTDTKVSGEHYYDYMLTPYKNVKISGKTQRFEAITTLSGQITKLGPVTNLKAAITDMEEGAPYSVNLTWKAVKGAEGYMIYYSQGGDSYYFRYATVGADVTEYLISKDIYDGKYQFKVVPYKYIEGVQREGGASNVATLYGLPAPYYLSCSTGAKGITLTYEYSYFYGVTNGIEIYRSTNGGKWTKIKTVKASDYYTYGSFTDTGAKTSGAYYQYKARMYVVDGGKTYYGRYSEPIDKLYLTTPVLSSVTRSDSGGFKLQWKKVTGADRYSIFRYDFDGNGYYLGEECIDTYEVTNAKEKTHTYVDLTAQDVGQYCYYIVAHGEKNGTAFESLPSTQKTGVIMQTPEGLNTENASKGVKLIWSWVNHSTGYEVWRSVNGGKWTKIKTTSSLSLNDTTATKNGATYSYKVRAISKMTGTTFYSEFCDPVSIVKMSPPTVKSVKALTEGGFALTFNRVSDAEYYWVNGWTYDGAHAFSARIEQEPKIKTYSVQDPEATALNTGFVYSITACRDVGGTVVTASSQFYAVNFGAPAVRAENVTTGIQVTAEMDILTDSYTIYRSVNGGKWSKLKTVSSNGEARLSYLDKSVSAGKTYSYKVEASNKSYYKAYTKVLSEPVSCYRVSSPKLTKVANSIGGITVTWAAQKGMPKAAAYEIYRSYDGYSYELVDTVSGDTLSYTDPSTVNSYCMVYYKVTAVPEAENMPTASTLSQKIYRLDAPTNISAVNDSTKTAAVWWECYGPADGYQIRYVTGKTTKTVTAKNGWCSCQLTGLASGKEYTISVRAYYTYDKVKYYSDWSEAFILYR